MKSKSCGRCNSTKDISDFNKDRSKKDGLYSFCRECQKIVKKNSYNKIGRETCKRRYKRSVKSQKNAIYEISNTKNKKTYIGKTNAYKLRTKSHIKKLNKNSHSNRDLQEDWNILGEENFNFRILKECDTDKDLEIYEALEAIRRLDNNKELYNHKFTFTTEDLVRLINIIKGEEKC